MITPSVTEVSRVLEPVTRDRFIDGLGDRLGAGRIAAPAPHPSPRPIDEQVRVAHIRQRSLVQASVLRGVGADKPTSLRWR